MIIKTLYWIPNPHHTFDRFLIIDDTKVYHIGSSLKDLGKKWFAFSKMDMDSLDIFRRLG